MTHDMRARERAGGDGCRDGARGVLAGGVHAEVLAAGAVGFDARRRDADEARVLAGGRRDVDVVVGLAPVERGMKRKW
ncbi:hypothetical protein GCM10025774_10620 [Microbacterium kyungheense]